MNMVVFPTASGVLGAGFLVLGTGFWVLGTGSGNEKNCNLNYPPSKKCGGSLLSTNADSLQRGEAVRV
jgi:hypothetical protein